MYSTTFCGVKVLFLQQVDDLFFASPSKEIAEAISDIIGKYALTTSSGLQVECPEPSYWSENMRAQAENKVNSKPIVC